jgi:hypothetical protein
MKSKCFRFLKFLYEFSRPFILPKKFRRLGWLNVLSAAVVIGKEIVDMSAGICGMGLNRCYSLAQGLHHMFAVR